MKFYFGKYRGHISAYTLLYRLKTLGVSEVIIDRLHIRYGPTLEPIANFLNERFGSGKPQRITVKLDPWDAWGADVTIAAMALPLIEEVRKRKQGSPEVDPDDVPVELRPTAEEMQQYRTLGEVDAKFHERWEWVMSEIIHALKQTINDDHYDDEGMCQLEDADPYRYHVLKNERKRHGLYLFGKYLSDLWV